MPWRPGQSGNPSGRPKVVAEVRDLARKHAPEAIATLVGIMRNEDATVITAAARRNGMRNLREDGWDKVKGGVTTPDEVLRVTQEF